MGIEVTWARTSQTRYVLYLGVSVRFQQGLLESRTSGQRMGASQLPALSLSLRGPPCRLYERGNTVVGVEGIEKPVREFFEKYPDLQHSVEDLPFGKVYKVWYYGR